LNSYGTFSAGLAYLYMYRKPILKSDRFRGQREDGP
jgi:hypothetical protein